MLVKITFYFKEHIQNCLRGVLGSMLQYVEIWQNILKEKV